MFVWGGPETEQWASEELPETLDLNTYKTPIRSQLHRLRSGDGLHAPLLGDNGVGKSTIVNLMVMNTLIDQAAYMPGGKTPEAIYGLLSGNMPQDMPTLNDLLTSLDRNVALANLAGIMPQLSLRLLISPFAAAADAAGAADVPDASAPAAGLPAAVGVPDASAPAAGLPAAAGGAPTAGLPAAVGGASASAPAAGLPAAVGGTSAASTSAAVSTAADSASITAQTEYATLVDDLGVFAKTPGRQRPKIKKFLLPVGKETTTSTTLHTRVRFGSSVHVLVEFYSEEELQYQAFKFVQLRRELGDDDPDDLDEERQKQLLEAWHTYMKVTMEAVSKFPDAIDPDELPQIDALEKKAESICLCPSLEALVKKQYALFLGGGASLHLDRKLAHDLIEQLNEPERLERVAAKSVEVRSCDPSHSVT